MVFIGVILLPITIVSVIVEKLVSDLYWNIQLRLFSGVIVWSTIVAGALVVYTLNMVGQIIILWQVAWFLSLFSLVVYLVLFKFPFIGEFIVHILYVIFNALNKMVNFRLKLEFDKEDVYIIFDVTKLTSEQVQEFITIVDEFSYEDVKEKTPMGVFHIVVPKNGCNIEEYNQNHVIYAATKFGRDIKKESRI
jgi:hypothetical protein